jgi:hypothetical protein
VEFYIAFVETQHFYLILAEFKNLKLGGRAGISHKKAQYWIPEPTPSRGASRSELRRPGQVGNDKHAKPWPTLGQAHGKRESPALSFPRPSFARHSGLREGGKRESRRIFFFSVNFVHLCGNIKIPIQKFKIKMVLTFRIKYLKYALDQVLNTKSGG